MKPGRRAFARKRLAKLGLEAGHLGEPTPLPWPEDVTAEGATLKEWTFVASQILAGIASPSWRPAPVPALSAVGIQVERAQEDPWTIRVSGPPGARIAFHVAPGTSPDAYGHYPDDPSSGVIDTRKTGAGAVSLPGGGGFEFEPTRENVVVSSIGPFAEVGPLPAEWLAACSDAWLVGALGERLSVGGSWGNAVAAGMYARLLEVGPARAREVVERALAGRPDPEVARARVWARSLTQEQISALEELAVAEIDWLHTLLQRIEAEPGPAKDGWRDTALVLCHARDDVEGVRLLLREAGAGKRLETALAALDEPARALVESLAATEPLDDERLRRVAAADHSAWWGRLALPRP